MPPRNRTFPESDWNARALFWHPVVEQQYPEDLPIDLHDEIHIRADRSSITYRQGLAAQGLGRSYTA